MITLLRSSFLKVSCTYTGTFVLAGYTLFAISVHIRSLSLFFKSHVRISLRPGAIVELQYKKKVANLGLFLFGRKKNVAFFCAIFLGGGSSTFFFLVPQKWKTRIYQVAHVAGVMNATCVQARSSMIVWKYRGIMILSTRSMPVLPAAKSSSERRRVFVNPVPTLFVCLAIPNSRSNFMRGCFCAHSVRV